MRKGRPLTPAEEKAQAEFEAWYEAKMQDLAAEEQERQEALRKGVLVSNTQDRFEYEWSRTTRSGKQEDCGLQVYLIGEELSLSAWSGWEPGAHITGEPARLLTAWLIERGYGPKGAAT